MTRKNAVALAFIGLYAFVGSTGQRGIEANTSNGNHGGSHHSTATTKAPNAATPPSQDQAALAPDQAALDNLLVQGWAGALYGNSRTKVRSEEVRGPLIALTFDDGPKPFGTIQILGILQKYNAHATFFVVGTQCERYPDLLTRISDSGDEIGNHTYDHRRLPTIPITEVADELEQNRKIIHQITGQTAFLFRPPGGRTNPEVQTIADSLGYTTVWWRVDSGELAPDMDPEKVYNRVVNNVRTGDIVLLHNGDTNILTALPRILDTLSRRGYRFVTVSELMHSRGATHVETANPETDTEWDVE